MIPCSIYAFCTLKENYLEYKEFSCGYEILEHHFPKQTNLYVVLEVFSPGTQLLWTYNFFKLVYTMSPENSVY